MKTVVVASLLLATAIASTVGQSAKKRVPKQSTPVRCGVGRISPNESKIEWRLAAEGDNKQYLYNTRRTVCDHGVLKAWIKVIEEDKSYQMQRVELKCPIDQMRIVSILTYGNDGSLKSPGIPDLDAKWEDVVPNSLGDRVFKTVCHKR